MINPSHLNPCDNAGNIVPAGKSTAEPGGVSSSDGTILCGEKRKAQVYSAQNIPLLHQASAPDSGVSIDTAKEIILKGQTSQYQLWEFETGGPIDSTPVVKTDGTVIFGGSDGKVYAVKDGNCVWDKKIGGSLISSPQLSDDGALLCSSNHNVYAIKDGTQVWSFDTETAHGRGVCAPVQGPDGFVYAGAGNGNLYFLIDGQQEYGIHVGDWMLPPVISNDGTVYVKTISGKIEAFRYKRGMFGKKITKLWEKEIGFAAQRSESGFTAGPDGTLYTGNYDGKVLAISKRGEIAWEFPTKGTIDSTPAVGNDGTVYIGSDDGNLYAIKDGQKLWEYKTRGPVKSKPAIAPDGTVFVGSDDGTVYGIKDGARVWGYDTGGPVRSSPVFDKDGRIYVTSHDKKLHVLSREPVKERLAELVREQTNDKPAIIEDDTCVIIDGKKIEKKR